MINDHHSQFDDDVDDDDYESDDGNDGDFQKEAISK